MDVQVIGKNKIGVVNLPRFFDFSDKNLLVKKIPEWIKDLDLNVIILNFSRTEFIGSSGVYPLFQFLAKKTFRQNRKKVKITLVGLCTEYKMLIDGLGMSKKFLVYNTIDAFSSAAQRTFRLSKDETQSVLDTF